MTQDGLTGILLSCLMNGVLSCPQIYGGIRWGRWGGENKSIMKENRGQEELRATRDAPEWLRSITEWGGEWFALFGDSKPGSPPSQGLTSIAHVAMLFRPLWYIRGSISPINRTQLVENAQWHLFQRVPDSTSLYVTQSPGSPWTSQTLPTLRPLVHTILCALTGSLSLLSSDSFKT